MVTQLVQRKQNVTPGVVDMTAKTNEIQLFVAIVLHSHLQGSLT